jgi:transposase
MVYSSAMDAADLPDDIEALKTMVLAEKAARVDAEARLEIAQTRGQSAEALILHMRLEILRLRRAQFGQKSERGARLVEQMELSLEDIEGDIAEDAVRTDVRAGGDSVAFEVAAYTRRQPKRGPLPEHLPRKRVVLAAPTSCPCCGSAKLSKLGEDITETLEVIPRKFFVKQTVRERWSCRACETVTQPPAPFHVIARGRAGPSLLAMIIAGKYHHHLPLHRQADAFENEGVPINVSTLADWIGACAVALGPLIALIRQHVFAAERLHADDTMVPVLAKGKTRTGRLWAYVRDDRPFGGKDPPAAFYAYTPTREGEHPLHALRDWSGFLQADAYSGFAALYDEKRPRGRILEVACWSHSRRKFFELADVSKRARDARVTLSPIAVEAVKQIDAIFAIEREINGLSADQRLAVRVARVKKLVDDLHEWMKEQRARISSKIALAKAMDYMLKRWDSFTRFLQDGRLCMTNNTAERALRCIAVGRKNWTFAGSDRGGERAASMYTLLQTARLNDVDPQAWLADVLARIAETPMSRLADLLPWNWQAPSIEKAA